jgi:hypothetical protein
VVAGIERRVILTKHDHLLELHHGPIGALQVGLVHREKIADLQDAGFEHLDLVAGGGRHEHDHAVGCPDDVDLVLAGTDGLDDDTVLAERIERGDRVGRRRREPAQRAPG